MSRSKRYSRKRGSFKNGFEAKLSKELTKEYPAGVVYEPYTFHYKVDEVRKYTPDFFVKGSKGLYIEGKGKFTAADRKKMLLVIAQHPEVEFRMYFVSADKKISKNSRTSYGDWCLRNNIAFTDLKRGLKKWHSNTTKVSKTTKSSAMTNRQSPKRSSGSTQLSETPGN